MILEQADQSGPAPLVELSGVSRVFEEEGGDRVQALDRVSLRIHAGEFVCITGPSGSGKSTLMHVIGCLDRATEGKCRIAGTDVETLDDDGLAVLRRHAFGFVFQSYNLLESLSAAANVELPATYAGLRAGQRHARAREILETLGLGDRPDHRPAELSGGEQQRVAIARALMNGARVILADEPTGAIDTEQGAEVLNLLEALAERGHAVVVVSHDRAVADRAHRVVELVDGRVVSDSGASLAESPGSAPDPQTPHRTTIPWLAAVRHGLVALRTSGLRGALTVFSVALGTWSVLALLGLSEGVRLDIADAMEEMGANRLSVSSMAFGKPGEPARLQPLTLADADAIAERVANVSSVQPGMWERLMVSRGGELIDPVIVRALSVNEPLTLQNAPWPLAEGTYLSEDDRDAVAQVAVIGPTIRDRLFSPDEAALGQHVDINGLPFVVRGVLAPHPRKIGEGEMMWSGPRAREWDGTVIHIPFETGANLVFGKENLNGLDVLLTDAERIDETAGDIKDLLFRHHGMDYDVTNDALIWISGKKLKAMHLALFGAIAGIALVLGGMTIVAVSLAGVSQRRREIGIRRAVGARRRDITAQFVVETGVATTFGGAIGALLSFGGSSLLAQITGAPVAFEPWFALVALGCAIATGLAFGIVPARRAAGLDPVSALATD
ncbi:MAG: ATP-binding cassette domain-containing protein [Gammaproteobacteria bacterium]|nr:ATP-binding cassette domain-containing protein [Gammaproteobacteria bacterium]